MLHERASESRSSRSVVHDPDPIPAGPSTDRDREYIAHLVAVRAMLRTRLPSLGDEWEAIYHEAWIDIWERRERLGRPEDDTRSLLKKFAYRRGVDFLRRRELQPDPIEPHSMTFEGIDRDLPTDEAVEIKLTADALQQIVATLDPRQRMLLKMRFDLRMGGKEIQQRANLTEKRMEKLFTRAFKAIAEQLDPDGSGISAWTQHQRSLLLACEIGIASPAQIKQAQQLVANDPRCRAMLGSMRGAFRDVAVVLPMPAAAVELDGRRGPIGAILDWSERAFASIRSPCADVAVTRASSAVSEHATATLAGGLGVGGAVKIAAACIAIGGTAVCVKSLAPVAHDKPPRPPAQARSKPRPAPVKPQPAPAPVVVQATAQPVTGKRVRRTQAQLVARAKAKAQARLRAQQSSVPVSSPKASPPASPVPAGTTEFGPGSSGSDPIAPEPAPAPQDGGGEFGP